MIRPAGVLLAETAAPCRRSGRRRSSPSGASIPLPTLHQRWVLALYLWGVVRLRAAGRPVAAVADGALRGRHAAVLRRDASGLAAYDTTLLSAHMVQHMVLSMAVPLALALGAPVTLALRTLPAPPAPYAAGGAALPGGAVCCPSRRWPSRCSCSARGSSTSPPGTTRRCASAYLHEMMHVHLVLVGSLFLWPLVGGTRCPGRVAYPFRMLLMVHDAAVPRLPGADDHEPGRAHRRGVVPLSDAGLAARPGRRPAAGRRHPLGHRRHRRARRSSSCSSRSGRARR